MPYTDDSLPSDYDPTLRKARSIPSMQIPSAAEARSTVDQGLYEKAQKQSKEVASKIQLAIAQGKTELVLSEYYLEPAVRKQLEDLGYQVKADSHRNEFITSISW